MVKRGRANNWLNNVFLQVNNCDQKDGFELKGWWKN
jgi:hypothetical protein